MTIASRAVQLAVVAAAALTFGASAASAQTVEVLDEATSEHCDDITIGADHEVEGGCAVHVTSTSNMNFHIHISGVGEVLFSSCDTEFVAQVGERGLGFLVDQVLAGANCGIEACDEPQPSHAQPEWPLGLYEGGGGNEALGFTLCLRPQGEEGSGNSYCTLLVDLVQSGHTQQLTAVEQSCVESPIEFSGTWVTDDSLDEVEIIHTHPGS